MGSGTITGAFAWWSGFYGALARMPGGSLGEALPCLVRDDRICALLAGAAGAAERPAYQPLVLWAGIAILALGLLLRLTAALRGIR